MLHGRTGGASQGRSGGIPAAAPERRPVDRRGQGGGGAGELGSAAFAETTEPQDGNGHGARLLLRGIRGRKWLGGNGGGGRGRSRHRKSGSEEDIFQQRFRADFQSRRASEPDRRRRFARHEPGHGRGSYLG